LAVTKIGTRTLLRNVREKLSDTSEPSVGQVFRALAEVLSDKNAVCKLAYTRNEKTLHELVIRPRDQWALLTRQDGCLVNISVVPELARSGSRDSRDAAVFTLLNSFCSRVKGKEIKGLALSIASH
jgi:hypothetical protein